MKIQSKIDFCNSNEMIILCEYGLQNQCHGSIVYYLSDTFQRFCEF